MHYNSGKALILTYFIKSRMRREFEKCVFKMFINLLQWSTSGSRNHSPKNYLILQDPQILDINADQEKVKVQLTELQSFLDDLQKRAFQYKSYQKNFKVMTALQVFLFFWIYFYYWEYYRCPPFLPLSSSIWLPLHSGLHLNIVCAQVLEAPLTDTREVWQASPWASGRGQCPTSIHIFSHT